METAFNERYDIFIPWTEQVSRVSSDPNDSRAIICLLKDVFIMKTVDVAIAIIFDAMNEKILVCKRKADTVLGGFWEFPGGKCNNGESLATCAVREVREEVGIDIRVLGTLPVIEHSYPHANVRLYPFVCQHVSGTPQLLAVAELTWAKPCDLGEYQFPPPNVGLVREASRGFAAVKSLMSVCENVLPES